jgi:hypothetical protein
LLGDTPAMASGEFRSWPGAADQWREIDHFLKHELLLDAPLFFDHGTIRVLHKGVRDEKNSAGSTGHCYSENDKSLASCRSRRDA